MKRLILLITFLLALSFVEAEELKSPDIYFGKKVGSDHILIPYSGIVEYLEYLDRQSSRITITDQGNSTLGNKIKLIIISSPKNLSSLNSLSALNKKLSCTENPNNTVSSSDLDKAKVFLFLTANLHSPEIASSQMVMILAHDLATTNDPYWLDVLDKIVLMIIPSANPDGNILVSQWYQRYLGTPFEDSKVPYLYHHYAGHDNNRDFFMLNLKESQIINEIISKTFFPQIFLDLHEMDSSGPRMFISPGTDPIHPSLSPLLMRELELASSFMALRLQERGKPGVGSRFLYDSYWPAGCNNTVLFKNVVGLLLECATTKMASPVYIKPDKLKGRGKGLPDHMKRTNYPDPWQGGWWRFNDIMEYQIIAVRSLLEFCALNKDTILSNYFLQCANNIKDGNNLTPFAFAIPLDQWDISEALSFIDKMLKHGVQVYKLKSSCVLDSRFYPGGTWIIPLNQPYRRFLLAMLEPQSYPEIRYSPEAEIVSPYDLAAWTVPIMMGLRCEEIRTPVKPDLIEKISQVSLPFVNQQSKGNVYVFSGRLNQSWLIVNRLLKKGKEVFRIIQDGDLKKGDFVLYSSEISEDEIQTLVSGTAVPIVRCQLDSKPSVKKISIAKIGIYQSYYPISDEGWIRWTLDKFEYPFTILHNEDFQSPSRLGELDTIIFPDLKRSYIIDGSFNRASNYPPDFRGGIGTNGIKNLICFVEEGGQAILIESASELGMLDFRLPLKSAISELNKDDFFCPGSLLKIRIDSSNYLGWGMPEVGSVMFDNGLAFKVSTPQVPWIKQEFVAEFTNEGDHLLSGYLKGSNYLNNTKLIISYHYKKGKVIAYGTRIHFRGWTTGAFKLILNALYAM
jgi:hypothetical protein